MPYDGVPLGVLNARYVNVTGDTMTGDLIVQAADDDNPFVYLDEYSTNEDRYGRLYFRKSRSNVAGTINTTINGDWLGNMKYMGVNDSDEFTGGAYMSVQQTGDAGDYVPTRMEWATYSDVAVNDDQFVMNSDGTIDTSGNLTVGGDLIVTGDDIFMTTNTGNYFLMADGTNYNPTAPAAARTGLALVVGTNVQAWDAQLDDIAALAFTDGNFIVGDGSNWVAESGATARTSLGLVAGGTGDIWVEKAGDTMVGNLIIDKDQNALTELRLVNDNSGVATENLGLTFYDGASKVFSSERTNNTGETIINNTGGRLMITTTTSGDILISPASDEVEFLNSNLTTTGTLDAGAITGSSLTDGTVTIASGSVTGTWADLGTVTTIDINGGTIDGAALGADCTQTEWDAAYTHIGESGASHSYIDQAVTVAGTPTFATLTTTGGRVVKTTRQTSTYTAQVTDDAIYGDTDGSAWTLTLPAGAAGQRFMITNCGSSGNDLTVDGNSTEAINGNATMLLTDEDSIVIVFEATEEWRIF